LFCSNNNGEIFFACKVEYIFVSEFFDRLREERTRLGLTQADVSEIVGTTKRTVQAWESGTTSPNAQQLAALRERGFDVLFLLSATRSDAFDHALTEREAEWLSFYRRFNGSAAAQDLLLNFMRFTQPPAPQIKTVKTVLLTAIAESKEAFFRGWLEARGYRVECGSTLSQGTDYVLFDEDDQLDADLLSAAAERRIPVLRGYDFMTLFNDLNKD
jgi:transcriptional regulator with XRE-family HTH domain